jgi:hypothetical protein
LTKRGGRWSSIFVLEVATEENGVTFSSYVVITTGGATTVTSFCLFFGLFLLFFQLCASLQYLGHSRISIYGAGRAQAE